MGQEKISSSLITKYLFKKVYQNETKIKIKKIPFQKGIPKRNKNKNQKNTFSKRYAKTKQKSINSQNKKQNKNSCTYFFILFFHSRRELQRTYIEPTKNLNIILCVVYIHTTQTKHKNTPTPTHNGILVTKSGERYLLNIEQSLIEYMKKAGARFCWFKDTSWVLMMLKTKHFI